MWLGLRNVPTADVASGSQVDMSTGTGVTKTFAVWCSTPSYGWLTMRCPRTGVVVAQEVTRTLLEENQDESKPADK